MERTTLFQMLAILLTAAGCLIILERRFADQALPEVRGWWVRVVLVNALQLGVILLGLRTWERWLQGRSLFHLHDVLGPAWGGVLAYFITTFVFYWWHRARHDVQWLWLGFHQLHHSARRIEAVTSFYKHPLEILANSVIMSLLLYPLLGLTAEASVWLSGLSAMAELLYHMNLRTPRWLGYLFQRPEMHRLHPQSENRGMHSESVHRAVGSCWWSA